MGLLFNADADRQLGQLQNDAVRQQLYERINDVLDAIEDDPSDRSVRQRRYQTPPVWGVTVYGSDETWLVLWSQPNSDVVIHYIGEDLR
ncbi:MAG: hypothetical protein OXN44_06575 [Acidimicrobiaceae bacterium]|nr:hypothetical protein [Acidimicrobiaceae bacterium]